ncbi:PQQ-binding-like beta-propeller repeat protein [Pseudalkalibacillus caeni]|uniref:Pyrrolo-quinoline quinone repeat domain-containing protein n=1 Tax=Exobacillus caeni TaxID=2574798 RepID=A0A5R9EY84_9BACL|nr:PQQ-binding-like beta-propeller repeat protein [Pseudalkalibacillus caeni]TLS35156.1 hypothetical protein FCL54_21785 [Pseudalkalibacillus caeni]
MKNKLFIGLIICYFFNMVFIANPSRANGFGPNEWTQYRMNFNNNPVFSNEDSRIINSSFKTGDQIRSTPVVVGDNIFIGNHGSGDIYSYNIITGDLNWENKAPNWIHSEILNVNNKLYVGYGNRFYQKKGELRGTGKSGLLCLDATTGKVLWNYSTKGEVMPTPAIYNDSVYIVTGDKHLYEVDLVSGKTKWEFNLGSIINMSSPVISNGVLFVGGSNKENLLALDLDKRKIKWETNFEGTHGLGDIPPALYNNEIVFVTALKENSKMPPLKDIFDKYGTVRTYKEIVKRALKPVIDGSVLQNEEHYLYALDAKNGEVLWKKNLGNGAWVKNNKSGAPMVYKNNVYLGSPITKKYYSVDVKSGEINWDYEVGFLTKAPPVAEKNIVYFTDVGGYVSAFDSKAGELLGRKQLGGKLAPSGPIIMNHNLIVGSQNSKVYALPTNDILGSNDKPKSNSLVFIGYIYIIPFLILIALVFSLRYLFKKRKKLKKDYKVAS